MLGVMERREIRSGAEIHVHSKEVHMLSVE